MAVYQPVCKHAVHGTLQTIQNRVNTSTHITKHPHITKQVKTTTVKDKHNKNNSNRNNQGYVKLQARM